MEQELNTELEEYLLESFRERDFERNEARVNLLIKDNEVTIEN